jgi:hypothetical protein
MRFLSFALLLAALLAACAAGDEPLPNETPLAPEETPPMGNPPMGGPDSLAGPGVSLAEILDPSVEGRALRARLNAPVRAETEAIPNRHVPGQVDTLRTLHYDGLALEFYEVTGGPTFLQTVTVTGGVYETAEGLGVGSTRGEVEAVYTHSTSAEPTDEGNVVTYERADGPAPLTLEVRYVGDDVAAMTWRFYVD